MTTVLITLGFSCALAFILGTLLGLFRELFRVEKDPLIDAVRGALPGANCGGCGYPGCDGYAEAVASKVAKPNMCTAGGKATAEAVAALVGSNEKAVDLVTVRLCQGKRDLAPNKGEYFGVPNCRAAKLSLGSTKQCAWGCLGFGDCVSVCRFDALKMGPDGLPIVDYSKCTGCGMCKEECPQRLFTVLPRDQKGAIPLCSNRNPVKANVLKNCKIGCIKCEACVRACQQLAITMQNGIPVVDYTKCTSCNACVEKCPTKVFTLLERDVIK